MSLITHTELVGLVDEGVIEGVDPDRINGASIDVTLGNTLYQEDMRHPRVVDLAKKQTLPLREVFMEPYYDMAPGEFVLASTTELFNLPDDIAIEFKLKSSLARNGLDHALAGWGDPGWNGAVLTLELINNAQASMLRLTPGMPIGQIVFWRGEPVPQDRSYRARGQYNNDSTTTPSKGVR